MPAATYGTPSPRAMDPWPIETSLATAAYAGDRSQLQSELQSYQLQRAAAEGQYGHELDAQHQFAKQQLAQQLYEANLKGLGELKDPTVLEIAANAPQYQQLFGGAGQAAVSDALQRAQTGQEAKNFAESGKGLEGFSNAGVTINDSNRIPGLAGVPITQGENARIAAERIRAGAMLGAASIRANAAVPRGLGIGFDAAPDPRFGGMAPHVTFNPKLSVDQNLALAQSQGLIKPQIQTPSPDAQPGTPAAQPSTTPPGKTGLQPMAKKDTPANTPAQAPAQVMNKVRTDVRAAIEATPITPQNKGKIDDIKAGYVGGQPNIIQTPKGLVVKGKSGQTYGD